MSEQFDKSRQQDKLCCLCASWIASDCLDDFEGEPCHKICKAEGVGRAYKPPLVAVGQQCWKCKLPIYGAHVSCNVAPDAASGGTFKPFHSACAPMHVSIFAMGSGERIYTKADAEAMCELAVAAYKKSLALSSTAATGDRGCPCLYTTPCKDNCTCVSWTSSAGCARCCTYGSLEQRTKNAERLASLPLSATTFTPPPGYTLVDTVSFQAITRILTSEQMKELCLKEGERFYLNREQFDIRGSHE